MYFSFQIFLKNILKIIKKKKKKKKKKMNFFSSPFFT